LVAAVRLALDKKTETRMNGLNQLAERAVGLSAQAVWGRV
jgi:hypothetical protein